MRNIIAVLTVGVLVSIGVFVGTSYSMKTPDDGQAEEERLGTSCLFGEFNEGETVSINNTKKEANYTFVIKNTCATDAKYAIDFEVLKGSTIGQQFVRMAVDSKNIKVLSDYSVVSVTNDNAVDARRIANSWVSAGTEVTYNLKLTLLDGAYDGELTGKVVVKNLTNE